MSVKIEFETDNDAFCPHAGFEINRILNKIRDDVAAFGPHEGTIKDSNGNTIGRYSMDIEPQHDHEEDC